ncbi:MULTISPECIES: hypothetical protein [Microbulbifer]|uniref:hypothetical protein n=1 Tax=Microbulbifer TaxID=48073 RepID=UPI000691FFF1|nr:MULTISPECIES: hypothetical protein [Microbulbifer]
MNTLNFVVLFSFLGLLIGWLLFVVFGQVTVKRLRKNPDTKDQLGLELVSGWDIFNAAQALATPRKFHKVLERGRLSSLNANSEVIRRNTNKFDRFLAIIFFWTFFISGTTMILAILLDALLST